MSKPTPQRDPTAPVIKPKDEKKRQDAPVDKDEERRVKEAAAHQRLVQAYREAGGDELPAGWKVIAKRRETGLSKGGIDYFFFNPSGKRIRSQKECIDLMLIDAGIKKEIDTEETESEGTPGPSNPAPSRANGDLVRAVSQKPGSHAPQRFTSTGLSVERKLTGDKRPFPVGGPTSKQATPQPQGDVPPEVLARREKNRDAQRERRKRKRMEAQHGGVGAGGDASGRVNPAPRPRRTDDSSDFSDCSFSLGSHQSKLWKDLDSDSDGEVNDYGTRLLAWRLNRAAQLRTLEPLARSTLDILAAAATGEQLPAADDQQGVAAGQVPVVPTGAADGQGRDSGMGAMGKAPLGACRSAAGITSDATAVDADIAEARQATTNAATCMIAGTIGAAAVARTGQANGVPHNGAAGAPGTPPRTTATVPSSESAGSKGDSQPADAPRASKRQAIGAAPPHNGVMVTSAAEQSLAGGTTNGDTAHDASNGSTEPATTTERVLAGQPAVEGADGDVEMRDADEVRPATAQRVGAVAEGDGRGGANRMGPSGRTAEDAAAVDEEQRAAAALSDSPVAAGGEDPSRLEGVWEGDVFVPRRRTRLQARVERGEPAVLSPKKDGQSSKAAEAHQLPVEEEEAALLLAEGLAVAFRRKRLHAHEVVHRHAARLLLSAAPAMEQMIKLAEGLHAAGLGGSLLEDYSKAVRRVKGAAKLLAGVRELTAMPDVNK